MTINARITCESAPQGLGLQVENSYGGLNVLRPGEHVDVVLHNSNDVHLRETALDQALDPQSGEGTDDPDNREQNPAELSGR